MGFVLRPSDRLWFRRCRRAWDFGSRLRRNLEPAPTPFAPDLEQALRDALAVYYFPGMWEWDRAIVRPLVAQELDRALHRPRTAAPDVTDAEFARWEAELATGRELIGHYLDWAPSVDRFWPVRVATDFDVQVPDWRAPGRDLVSPAGEPIRYQGRVDMLVVDEHDAYWVVRHRLARDRFADFDRLALDDGLVAAGWAWEIFYLGMRVAGTIHNELLLGDTPRPPGLPGGAPPGAAEPVRRPRPARAFAAARAEHRRMYAQAEQVPREVVVEEGGGMFRRTYIPRGEAELAGLGRNLAGEALDMVDPDLAVYPAPAAHCSECAFRPACLALQQGADAEAILAAGYRTRPPETPEEGRLGGGTWSMNRGAAPPPHWRGRNP